MGNDENIDETALNVLLANGVDPITAYAGSIKDDPDSPRTGSKLGAIVWLIAAIVAVTFAAFFVLR